MDARIPDFQSIAIDTTSEVIFTREYMASDLENLSYDLSSGIFVPGAVSVPLFTLASDATNWNSEMVISINLSSATLSAGSLDLLTTEIGDLAELVGVDYNITYDNSLVYSGVVGDAGTSISDFDLALNVENNNTLTLDITSATSTMSSFELSNVSDKKVEGLLA